ncbi:peptidoglycan DD-metalloendopeptidase family protein [Arachidicoccus sp.]|uniref:peptidoglycan DD-metalloendopeptidase family protein n=1 Tax=Arachidicoccus sp. TaxID=1872624 RepID=UPI003D1BE4F5
MIRKLFVLAFTVCIFHVCGFGQQTRAEIQEQQKYLKQELADLNASLSSVRKTKKLSLRELNLIQQKIKARQSLINSINKELGDLDETIAKYNHEIDREKQQLDTLKGKYAQSLIFAYKNRSNYNYINFLFSSNSFNDAIRRVAYLKSYRQFRETQADNIIKAQTLLKGKISSLENTKTAKNSALVKQGTQLTGLQNDRNEKDSALVLLKGKEGDLGKEITANAVKRKKLQRVLQSVIRQEIAEAERKERERQAKIEKAREEQEERDRIAAQQKALAAKQQEIALANAQKAAVAQNSASDNKPPVTAPVKTRAGEVEKAKTDEVAKTKEPTKETPAQKEASERANRSYNVLESTTKTLTESLDFEKNKGKLPWPTNGGFVSASYGIQTIPGTKLKQENDGIEITATNSTVVKSVATGTVSVVISDGGYSVIVREGKYFTTYSNLSSVSVNRGDNVDAGTIIGQMATDNASGAATVFFMVTDSQGNSLNPMSWLGKR